MRSRLLKGLAALTTLCMLIAMAPAALMESLAEDGALEGQSELTAEEWTDDGISEAVESEVPEANEVGVDGLVMENQEGDLPAEGELPSEGDLPAEGDFSEDQRFYARIVGDEVQLYPSADAEESYITISEGEIVLVIAPGAFRTGIAYASAGQIAVAWVASEWVEPLPLEEIDPYLDALTAGEVALYEDDLNWPVGEAKLDFADLLDVYMAATTSEASAYNRIFVYDQYGGGWSSKTLNYGRSGGNNMENGGCHIFTYAHAIQWLTGTKLTSASKNSLIDELISVCDIPWGPTDYNSTNPIQLYRDHIVNKYGANRVAMPGSAQAMESHFAKGGVVIANPGGHYILGVGSMYADFDTNGSTELYIHIVDSTCQSTWWRLNQNFGAVGYNFSNYAVISGYSYNGSSYINGTLGSKWGGGEYWVPYSVFSKFRLDNAYLPGSVPAYDTLQFIDIPYPKQYYISSTGFIISSGTVASNVNLSTLKSELINSSGTAIDTYSVSGIKSTVFSLASINSNIRFGSKVTSAGSYTWRLTATDSSGRTLVLDMPFTAYTSGSIQSSTISKKYVDYYQPTGVTLSATKLTLTKGDWEQLTATVTPSNATNPRVTWTTSNAAVATVNSGIVMAKGGGTATITAKTEDGGKTATCVVTVIVPVTGLMVNPSSVSLKRGETTTLSATVSPSDATNKNVTWESKNPTVATVKDGVVTAVSAGGALILAITEDGARESACMVAVTNPEPEDLLITSAKGSLRVGDSDVPKISVTGQGVGKIYIDWNSSDNEIAWADSYAYYDGSEEDWRVYALQPGTATITASYDRADGKVLSSSYQLSVLDYSVSTLSFVNISAPVKIGLEGMDIDPWVISSGIIASDERLTCVNSQIRRVVNGQIVSYHNYTTTGGGLTLRGKSITLKALAEQYNYDNGMVFDYATMLGDYVWILTAEDAKGRVLSLEMPFEMIPGDNHTQKIVSKAYVDPDSCVVEAETTDIKVGESTTIKAVVLPENAMERSVIWECSDPTVLELISDGDTCRLKGIKKGTANVTVRLAKYPTISESIFITVKNGDWKAAPVLDSVENIGGGKVKLIWTGNGVADQYSIYELVNNSQVFKTYVNAETAVLENVSAGSHTYIVKPRSTAPGYGVVGEASNMLTVTVNEAWKTAPVLNSVVNLGGGKVQLKWTGNGVADQYSVYEMIDGSSVFKVYVNAETVTISGVGVGSHTYIVRPRSTAPGYGVVGDASNAVTVKVEEAWKIAPVLNQVVDLGGGKVHLQWTGNGVADQYSIYEVINGALTFKVYVNAVEATLTSVSEGTHTYVVKPRSTAPGYGVVGEASNSVTVKVKALEPWKAAPVLHRATSLGGGKVELQWTGNGVAEQYSVYEITDDQTVFKTFVDDESVILYNVSVGSHRYIVRPRAMPNGYGVVGEASNIVSVVVAEPWKTAPVLQSAEYLGSGKVVLTWKGNGVASQYSVYEVVEGVLQFKTYLNAESLTLTGVAEGSHTYVVKPRSTALGYGVVGDASNALTVEAVDHPLAVTITWNANGGTCVDAATIIRYGSTIGTLPTPSRSYYRFDGWFTAASGGTQVTASTAFTEDAKLYAHWTRLTCTITYNANGGTVTPASKAMNQGDAIGTLPTPSRSYYRFDGWFTAASGGTQVTTSTVYTANATIYAHWTRLTCTITYNANGGTVTPASKAMNQGDAIGTLPTPSRSYYTFDGWYTTASGGTKVTTSTVFTANTTIYAHWTINGFGAWSDWSTTAVTATDNREVKTEVRQVQTGTKTVYNYSRYIYWNDSAGMWYATYAVYGSQCQHQTTSSETPFTKDGVRDGNQRYNGEKRNGTPYWYFETVTTTPIYSSVTYYSYRDRIK